MKFLKYYISIVLTGFFLSVYARESSFFEHYSTQDGLSCDFVTSITQDVNGFIWVGTEYGLNRFDGMNFVTYTKNDYPSMMRNDIRCLNLFSDGTLAVAGYHGMLQSYDAHADTFRNRQFPDLLDGSVKTVVGFQEISDGNRYLLTTSGVYFCDTKSGSFAEKAPISDSTNRYFVESFYRDKNGNFWVGAFDGLHLLSPTGSHLRYFSLGKDDKISATSILEMDQNHILVASNVGSLWLFELDETGNVRMDKKLDSEFRNVSVMMKDKKGRIWLGTWGYGLWRMDTRFSFRRMAPYNGGESLQKIHSLFQDRAGNVWIGTQNSGLWCYRADRMDKAIHSSDLGFPNVDASCFVEDDQGAFYVGSDGHGIFKLSDDFQCLSRWQRESGLKSNNVLSFSKLHDGDLLFTTWSGGLERMDVHSGKVTPFPFYGLENTINSSKCVRVMRDGEVWVAIQGDGIYRRRSSGVWTKMKFVYKTYNDDWIDDIEESANGIVWIVSTNGVWRYDKGDTLFFSMKSDGYDPDPYSFHDGVCDADGNFYVASNRGVVCCRADGGSMDVLDYLPNGNYASLFIDASGMLWCSGSCGILRVNLKDSTYYSVPVKRGGRGNTYFLPRSIYRSSAGDMFFGCSDGFVVFNPDMAHRESMVDYLAWSNLWVDGEKTHITDNHVVLKHGAQMNVSFDLLNLSGVDDVICSYRVVELDNRWHGLNGSHSIPFNYIPAGSYTLELMAYRNGHKDRSSVLSMKIDVLPPWWATVWFRLLALLSLLVVVAIAVYMRFLVMKRRQRNLQEMVDLRTADLMNAMKEKDRLVSIIAHDLKNPMFSIVCGLEMLTERLVKVLDEKDQTILKTVSSSARNLQKELLQLLDWATSRQLDVKCLPTDVNLKLLVDDVLALLKGLLTDKLIVAHVKSTLSYCAYVDGRMIGTVIRNLMNNAIKFTPKRGDVYISIYEKDGCAVVEVRDTGVGMDDRQLSALRQGDGASTKGTENESGTGLGFRICTEFVKKNGGSIGLDSTQGGGTTVTVCLPVSKKVVEDDSSSELPKMESPIVKEADSRQDLLDGNTVLVVDDDPLLRLNVRNLLGPYMTVLEAEDGEEGLSVALRSLPDIIVTDMDMPKMNGLQMVAALHVQKSTSHIPLIFLSAKNSEEDRMGGLSSGAIDYISKPFSANELLTKVTNILNWRRVQQQRILTGNYKKEGGVPVINPLLKNVLEAIEAHYKEPEFSVEDLSKCLLVSKSTLIRRLKSITDKTPVEILSEYRLNKADVLLRQQNLPVKEVAYMVGFNDQYYFSRKYKEHFGYPPSKA